MQLVPSDQHLPILPLSLCSLDLGAIALLSTSMQSTSILDFTMC